MEADLSAHHNGCDLRDYWRRDEHGRRRLTLRQIAVRLRHLPADSATALAELGGTPLPTRLELLVMQLIEATTGEKHALREQLPKDNPDADPERRRARGRARARAAERQRQIEAGQIT